MTTLRLRIESPAALTRTAHFQTLPVRIGRDPESEYRLDYSFISRQHARIDIVNGELALCDEGGREGTRSFEDRRRLPAHQWIPLATLGHRFLVGPFVVRADLVDDETANHATELPSEDLDSTDAEGSATVHYEAARVDVATLNAKALRDVVHEMLDRHQEAVDALTRVLTEASSLPADPLRTLAQSVLEREPAWDSHAPIREFIEKSGLHPAPARIEVIAFRLLQDMSRYYVPYAPPLGSAEAIAEFVNRLDHVLATLLEGTSALRFAFLSETHAASPSDLQMRDLASHLLDWTAPRRMIDEMSDQFAAMVGHHHRLVAEGLVAVERALASLRPSVIEAELRGPWTPFRHRKLWAEFSRRHARAVQRPSTLGRTLVAVGEALGLLRAEFPITEVGLAPAS